MRRTVLVLAALLAVTACDPVVPPGEARVTGGIMPCGGVRTGPPHYAAGEVTVLAGNVRWVVGTQPGGPDLVDELPTKVVARQTVSMDRTYAFDLIPGDYVLQARYLSPTEAEATPYASVTVHRGDDVRVDIPSGCF